MCVNLIIASTLEKIQSQFSVHLSDSSLPISSPQLLTKGAHGYVITSENDRELKQMKFGFTPHWATQRMNTLNARAEGDKNQNNDPYYNGPNAIFLKPAYKKAIQNYRCLIVVDSFIDIGSFDQPYMIFVTEKKNPFVLAGIYDYWKDPESGLTTPGFAVITIPANESLQKVGIMRVPVAFTRLNCADWIKASKPLNYYLPKLQACGNELINAYPISREYRSGLTDLNILKPMGKRLLAEGIQAQKISKTHYAKKQKHEQTTTTTTLAERLKLNQL